MGAGRAIVELYRHAAQSRSISLWATAENVGNLDLAVSVFVRGILGIILAMALGMGLWVVASLYIQNTSPESAAFIPEQAVVVAAIIQEDPQME